MPQKLRFTPFAVLALSLLTAEPASAASVQAVPSVTETAPVAHGGDAADDPAIWAHPSNPALSLIIGNDKAGALESYNLGGSRVQRITNPEGFYGNIDVRGNYISVAKSGIRIYTVNPATRKMSIATEGGGTISTSGEGLCLYDRGAPGLADGFYTFVITRTIGRVRQYAHADQDGDGLVTGSLVRDFTIGSESEGCVVDDQSEDVFISEEDVAIWRYGANPGDGTARMMVDEAGPGLPPDIEGLTLAGEHLFASAQNVAAPNQNWINVYSRVTPYTLVKSVRIVGGTSTDDCDRTDGIAAHAGYLGRPFTQGLFVCQDGSNGPPGTTGNQNFKLVPLDAVVGP